MLTRTYTGVDRPLAETLGNNTRTEFAYDALKRLTERSTFGPAAQEISRFAYGYDRVGNRLTEQGTKGGTPIPLYLYKNMLSPTAFSSREMIVCRFKRFETFLPLACIVIVGAMALSSTPVASKSAVAKKTKLSVFANREFIYPYQVVGDIEEKAGSYSSVLKKLRSKTGKLNADAIIDFSMQFETKADLVFGGSNVSFIGKGMAIRWEDPNTNKSFSIPTRKGFKNIPLCKQLNLPVFETDAAPKPYVILGKIYAYSLTPEQAFCNLKRESLRFQGDAIVKYHLDRQAFVSKSLIKIGKTPPAAPSVETKNIAQGIVIRWARPEEKGLTRLAGSDKVAIPLLE